MKDNIGSKRHKLGTCLASAVNALLFITILLLQVMVIWNIADMFFGGEESTSDANQEQAKANVEQKRETKFNHRRFEIEVNQPHQEMLEKFPKHPNLVFSKLAKAIEKEDKRIIGIQNEISDIRTKLGITTMKPVDKKNQNASSWFWSSSNFFSRKLQHVLDDTALKEDEELRQSEIRRFYNDIDIDFSDGQENDIAHQCPIKSPLLVGPLFVRQKNIPNFHPNTKEFHEWFGNTIHIGGSSAPENCIARQKVAIIVPYRDRKEHLDIFLYHLHPILQRQQLDYRIFVIEQSEDGEEFNRASLMNVGYMEANKLDRYFCFIFHDVDLLPEDDRNMYMCPPDSEMLVKHLSVAINKWKYRLQYHDYFGGVSAISKIHFKRMNGFPNGFYGWGGEDDELAQRTNQTQLTITRQAGNIARYTMLKHDGAKSNKKNIKNLMHLSKDLKLLEDGLNTVSYKVIQTEKKPLYTRILVNLPAFSDLPRKELYITTDEIGEKKTQPGRNNDIVPDESPFMVAMFKNVGALTTLVGKSVAKEVLVYSLKHAEKMEELDSHVY